MYVRDVKLPFQQLATFEYLNYSNLVWSSKAMHLKYWLEWFLRLIPITTFHSYWQLARVNGKKKINKKKWKHNLTMVSAYSVLYSTSCYSSRTETLRSQSRDRRCLWRVYVANTVCFVDMIWKWSWWERQARRGSSNDPFHTDYRVVLLKIWDFPLFWTGKLDRPRPQATTHASVNVR